MIRRILMYGQGTKKYVLSQFPYPSGDLHLGHARVYYIGDAFKEYYRMKGSKTFYPIGWDAFGLPAENAAILHKQNPQSWTQNNIQRMKQQMQKLKVGFNWEAEVRTCSPSYYKWTQDIFLRLWQKGLAYRGMGEVNWDPIDKTVLANEQVDEEGRSWRSGALVEKKMLKQWFFKISAYAKPLQEGLNSLSWIQRVKAMQAGWIGYQEGYQHKLPARWLDKVQPTPAKELLIFCKDSEGFSGSELHVRYNVDPKETLLKEGEVIGFVKHPKEGEIKIVIGHEQNGIKTELISSGNKIKGVNVEGTPTKIMRLRDWSVSRQRYWGTPIPIIYCPKCGTVPVPRKHLPVVLPPWEGNGNPLHSDQFRNCICPSCSGPALRQTDTMDTFVDSSWYYLRFLNPENNKILCEPELANETMPVDLYIGGIQHAIMHLLYARFIMHFLHDEGICKEQEPFKELIVQGLVKGKTYKLKGSGRYLQKHERESHSSDLEITFEKMSKSKFNGVNPNSLVDEYGTDALRLALFFASPPDHDIDFSDELMITATRFLSKVQDTCQTICQMRPQPSSLQLARDEPEVCYILKHLLEKMEIAMQKRYLHVYVANLMEMLNYIRSIYLKSESKAHVCLQIFDIFVKLLAVVSPDLSQNLKPQISTFAKRNAVELDASNWPNLSRFGSLTEYLIMKGKKLVKRGIINSTLEDNQIVYELKLQNPTIKRNKKNIIIII